jgi:hypothetical protein
MSRFVVTQGRPEALVAFGAPRDVTYGELFGLAQAISRALTELARDLDTDASRAVLLLCEDRYYCAAALLGAWQAGLTVTLPPSRGSAAVG